MKETILEVIGDHVLLTRSGKNYFGLCPFHKEKTPSFSVSVDRQIYHCFGCGATGTAEEFRTKIEELAIDRQIVSVESLHDAVVELYENGTDESTLP